MAEPRANYGLDAPPVVRNLILGGVACVVAALLVEQFRWMLWPAPFLFGEAALMVWSSRVGKLQERDRLLDSIEWRGDERVLDVGCGRGLMLIGAAKRLTAGRSVGVDIWRNADQWGNHPENTRENARREGVAERVVVASGDAARLPFADESFDLVLSSLALHNLEESSERRAALSEIARVLRPGGCVLVADIRHAADYAATFRACGLQGVHCSRRHFRIFPPVRVVTACKPGAPQGAMGAGTGFSS